MMDENASSRLVYLFFPIYGVSEAYVDTFRHGRTITNADNGWLEIKLTWLWMFNYSNNALAKQEKDRQHIQWYFLCYAVCFKFWV
jgi:hypothetical protein